jgi:hypothetical protein
MWAYRELHQSALQGPYITDHVLNFECNLNFECKGTEAVNFSSVSLSLEFDLNSRARHTTIPEEIITNNNIIHTQTQESVDLEFASQEKLVEDLDVYVEDNPIPYSDVVIQNTHAEEQAAQADVGIQDLHDEDHGVQTEKFQADVVMQDYW